MATKKDAESKADAVRDKKLGVKEGTKRDEMMDAARGRGKMPLPFLKGKKGK